MMINCAYNRDFLFNEYLAFLDQILSLSKSCYYHIWVLTYTTGDHCESVFQTL